MQSTNTKRLRARIAMILLDAVAVNISYFIALLVRYYVHFEFKASAAKYLPMFYEFAPIYTVLCLVVFYLMKMYHGMWKYAGLSEMNRILAACVITSVAHVVFTVAFFEPMSPSYYLIGGIIQLVLIAGSRFGYRIWRDERNLLAARKQASRNVMIIGASETGRRAVKYLQLDAAMSYRPACIVDTWENDTGRVMEGIPVIGGVPSVREAISKYDIKEILFADPMLTPEDRNEINEAAREKGLEVQNFNASFFGEDKGSAKRARDYGAEIKELHHIAIIVSSEKSIEFYGKLGFREIDRMDRGYDIIVMMEGPCLLEFYIDPTHPPRVNRPEALGLRHLALQVDNLEQAIAKLDGIEIEPIREIGGKRFTFIKDPDGLPIKLHE